MPAFGIIIGRLTATNERFLAMNRKEDTETLKMLLSEDPIGKTIFVKSAADANRFSFNRV